MIPREEPAGVTQNNAFSKTCLLSEKAAYSWSVFVLRSQLLQPQTVESVPTCKDPFKDYCINHAVLLELTG